MVLLTAGMKGRRRIIQPLLTPLWARVASEAVLIERHLLNPEEFWHEYPRFLAKNEEGYYQQRNRVDVPGCRALLDRSITWRCMGWCAMAMDERKAADA